MKSAQLKSSFLAEPTKTAHALGVVLRDFGYNVNDAYVEAEVKRLLAGGEKQGGPSMFLAGWLEEGLD